MRAARNKATTRNKLAASGGRERLIEAVVQLGATAGNISSLSLREVARAAGLNPNTFYRHFNNFDDLGLVVIDRLSRELRAGLRALRVLPGDRGLEILPSIVRQSIGLTFDFILEHRSTVVVGIRELHGSSPALRGAMRRVIDELALDMSEDIWRLLKVPEIDPRSVQEISRLVIRQMCFFGLEYVEQPDQRLGLRREAERFILLLVLGALAEKAPHLIKGAKLKLPSSTLDK